MRILLTYKGSASSGWYAPPEGTHSGEKHRSVGSGRSGKAQTVVDEVKTFVGRLTISGGDIGKIELSPEARELLAQTVTKDSYRLYRGIGIVKGRVTREQMNELRNLRSGDLIPDYLAKKGNPFASYTTKKTIAKYYSEGKISLITEATVSKRDIVVVTRNLRSIMKKVGQEDAFSESTYDYFKDEAEVIVREPISASVMSIK